MKLNLDTEFWDKISKVVESIGSRPSAVGWALLWLNYENNRKGQIITDSDWNLEGFPTALIGTFALRTEHGFKAYNASARAEIAEKRKNAGRKGGASKAKASKTKQNLANAKTQEAKPNLIIQAWCDAYSRKYGTKYDITRKDAGMLAGFAKDRSLDKASILFACYLAMELEFYAKEKHPLSLFFRDLPKITYAAQTGVDPTRKKTLVEEYLEAEAKKARKVLT